MGPCGQALCHWELPMVEAVREVAALVAGPAVVSVVSLPVCWGKVLRKRLHQMLQGDRGPTRAPCCTVPSSDSLPSLPSLPQPACNLPILLRRYVKMGPPEALEVANYVPLGVGVFCCFRVKKTARDAGLEKGAAKV